MYNLLHIEFFLHYRTLQKISNILTSSIFSSLTVLILRTLHFVIYYLNTNLITQRPSKVPVHYRDKLNTLLKELEKNNIMKKIESSLQDKPVYGTTYLNPLIIIPKGDSIKCVLDARHLYSNTEQSDESWPIEPHAPQLARANKKYKCDIDLMYAYAHTPLDEERNH